MRLRPDVSALENLSMHPNERACRVLQEKGEIQLEGDEPLLGKGSVQSMLQQFLWDKGKPSKA